MVLVLFSYNGDLLSGVSTLASSLEESSLKVAALGTYVLVERKHCENGTSYGRIAAAQTDVIAAAPCAAFSLPCWRTPPQRSTS